MACKVYLAACLLLAALLANTDGMPAGVSRSMPAFSGVPHAASPTKSGRSAARSKPCKERELPLARRLFHDGEQEKVKDEMLPRQCTPPPPKVTSSVEKKQKQNAKSVEDSEKESTCESMRQNAVPEVQISSSEAVTEAKDALKSSPSLLESDKISEGDDTLKSYPSLLKNENKASEGEDALKSCPSWAQNTAMEEDALKDDFAEAAEEAQSLREGGIER